MKKNNMRKIISLIAIILFASSSSVFAQKTEVDTNVVEGKNMMIKGDKQTDVKKLKVYIVEGVGTAVAKREIVSNGKYDESQFPVGPGIFHLLVSYENLNATEMFLITKDAGTEKIHMQFYRKNGFLFCRLKTEISEDLNKLIVLE
jgi:hypothetical protein